ncbi:nitroreductase [Rhodopila globiformis]|uniref:Nitrobenzoate reductase n=1 Tax=Rhodopila globiformis TaxID=1071 RepID=A0A2S6N8Y2_RHOGL|nr:nitroreductase [Rhodopila globiformis]PPQ31070.1 nitrobenzoate reductase [Rhodopila globiformis]
MNSVDEAIATRRSIRRFLPTPVPAATVEAILDVSARAPSGTNMQPWRGYVLAGAPKDRLVAAVQAAFDAEEPGHAQEVQYYPDEFFEPYLSRRRAVGWELYGLLGIARGQAAKMKAQHRRNFQFFDAPVGLIFTIDRRLATGSWLDYGMFLENVMVAARGRGLDTCAQAAWTHFHKAMRPVLGLGEEEIVVCGMALGYADPDAPENGLATVREPARLFMRFDGFEDFP